MSDKTAISWTDATWNPVRGCTKVSAGCKNCYAETVAERWRGIKGHPFEQGFDLRLVPESLRKPLHWKAPRRIFVNSMSDLFHEEIPNEYIAAVFGVMAACPRHTFQVLTKRAARMRDWFEWIARPDEDGNYPLTVQVLERALATFGIQAKAADIDWPLPNVHLGVSAENQPMADERIPLLLQCQAAVRWVSAEPLLGPIDMWAFIRSPLRDESLRALHSPDMPGIDWVVVGGESGTRFREMEVAWATSIVDQCKATGVPVFVKQDSMLRPGKQGRLLDDVWAHKEFPG